ncbi:MarR family transcriptional regulator [uncultured Williamsia sp.]|uniref:MarR family winged helix-turn-helix transcriptional regulator n=1 Tax=uncultured Williamsia sp. TaxID=259311 RepID=UPI00261E7D1B|nr:MarR family transcriptional regulator [uncultured Williamsia sp.]
MTSDDTPSVGVLLARATRAVEERMAPVLDTLGVTADQWRVLVVLGTSAGITMSDLARLSVLSAAGATRAVDSLTERALVYRRADPTDRRRVVVFLSAHGASRMAPALEAAARIDAAIAAEIGSARFLALGDGLIHLVSAADGALAGETSA